MTSAPFTADHPLRIGTRGSPLALVQANEVARRLREAHGLEDAAVEIVPIVTSGDREQVRPLAEIGGKGLFAVELETALHEGEIHLAVHSMKDVETVLHDAFEIVAMLPREDTRDAWVSPAAAHPRDLPQGAVVGTASLRRGAQIRAMRPDIKIVNFRGNVQTRIDKLASGDVQGTLLALAGLKRLGLEDKATCLLDAPEMIAAVGQGAIGIEIRKDAEDVRAAVAVLDDADTSLCVGCERAMLAELDGTCRTPIGGHAVLIPGGRIKLTAVLLAEDGSQAFRFEEDAAVADARALGTRAGRTLKQEAGEDFVANMG
ncbi:hydroxymethylbilane synthase [Pyruvatibacter sp.]